MSRLTSLALSFNNLRTKKARTILTSFAGSIGIIGIALILSISNGVNAYITDIQKNTMSAYPISIEAQTMDLSSLITSGQENHDKSSADANHKLDAVYSDTMDLEMASMVTTSITENNLTDFKKYLDDKDSEIQKYIGENGVTYSYNTKFNVYTYDPEDKLVNTDGSTLENTNGTDTLSMMTAMSQMSVSMSGSVNNFEELMPGVDGQIVSKALTDNYDLVYGKMPEKHNELVLVLDSSNEIAATQLYQLGFLPSSDYKKNSQETGKRQGHSA
jgi:putative ABC transport system permease protein